MSWPNATERRGEIRTVASDGSETKLIAQPAAAEPGYWDPCWLPDGSLVFSHLIMDARGLRRFDPRTGEVAAVPGTESLLYPKCSWQGDLWATAVERSGQASSRLRRHGSDEWVDPGVFVAVHPSFTGDGRAVCGLSSPGLRVECFSLDTRRTTLLTNTAPLELARWVVVPWMGLDASDRPMVAVESGRMETIYALEWGPR